MRKVKRNSILNMVNSYIIDSPLPSNINYFWNFGSLLGLGLIIQVITGVILAMNYLPSIDLAFISVEHIMRDLNYGYIIRYTHANGAAMFFICLYIHIARGLYYNSYTQSNLKSTWIVGVVIFILSMATAFLGYCLPYGQLSYWAVTVICSLLTAIPIVGEELLALIWGGYSVDQPTLNRFFSFHYLLPFGIIVLVIVHLITLHNSNNKQGLSGSNNPLGIGSNIDRIRFHPYYSYKDLVGFIVLILIISSLVFYNPNLFNHSDNYIQANPLVTPISIQPEFYFLPYYAILRAIPSKLFGVVGMMGSIVILVILPRLHTSLIRGLSFAPISKIFYWVFIVNFFILGYNGAQHPEDPYVIMSQVSTIYYLSYFIIIVPIVGHLENLLFILSTKK